MPLICSSKMRVAVGTDVEASCFLGAQIDRNRVLVLFAAAQIYVASRKLCEPSPAVYQLGRGNEPMIEVGKVTPADALYMTPPVTV
jgi:hypothetical protein